LQFSRDKDDDKIIHTALAGAAFSYSLEMGATLEDVAGTIRANPALGEAVQEAALRALGHALHI
jgi:hypothetical protein